MKLYVQRTINEAIVARLTGDPRLLIYPSTRPPLHLFKKNHTSFGGDL
jgi:hypothetical protein